MIKYENIHKNVSDQLLERFLRYVRIHTTSNEELASRKTPSTECQWDLIYLLEKELADIGLRDISVNECGYLIARLPDNRPKDATAVETIGFMAHLDTNEDAPGENVNPIVHQYDGGTISLQNGISLKSEEFPLLRKYIGEKVITSDGNTLLGADDKSGIAEIITAVDWLIQHPEIPHGDIEIIFTPDEETGLGMSRFPVDRLASTFCFTLDGGEEGELETECYYARKAVITCVGKLLHPGSARGKMVNAVSMACSYVAMLPRNESPEATDGRYGNYWPHRITGDLEKAELTILFRDFEADGIARRENVLAHFARAVEAAYPGGKVELDITEQYRNMREEIARHPRILERLRQAYALAEVLPIENPIRGGTDGSKLTAMGIPTPNIFAGGQNFHSRQEWVALPAMSRAVTVILNLVELWANP